MRLILSVHPLGSQNGFQKGRSPSFPLPSFLPSSLQTTGSWSLAAWRLRQALVREAGGVHQTVARVGIHRAVVSGYYSITVASRVAELNIFLLYFMKMKK